jgi:hypothetical protein
MSTIEGGRTRVCTTTRQAYRPECRPRGWGGVGGVDHPLHPLGQTAQGGMGDAFHDNRTVHWLERWLSPWARGLRGPEAFAGF